MSYLCLTTIDVVMDVCNDDEPFPVNGDDSSTEVYHQAVYVIGIS